MQLNGGVWVLWVLVCRVFFVGLVWVWFFGLVYFFFKQLLVLVSERVHGKLSDSGMFVKTYKGSFVFLHPNA